MRKTKVYGGRCWGPPEWRDQFDSRFRSKWPSIRIAVTGAVDRHHAASILVARMPLLAPPEDYDENPEAYGLIRELVEEHGGLPDTRSVRRMMRRMHAWPRPRGVTELIRGKVIDPYAVDVYVWHLHRPGQHVYAVDEDRHHLFVVGQFQTRSGRAANGAPRRELIAVPSTYHEFEHAHRR